MKLEEFLGSVIVSADQLMADLDAQTNEVRVEVCLCPSLDGTLVVVPAAEAAARLTLVVSLDKAARRAC